MREAGLRYWDEMAKKPSSARDAILAGYVRESEFDESGRIDARSLILPHIKHGDRVVDVGCGIGRIAKWVAPHCRDLLALDISEGMLSLAAKRLHAQDNLQFAHIPLSLKLPVRSRSVDFVYLYHVFEHLEREDAFRILCQIRRILKPAGSALLQFSLLDNVDNQQEFLRWSNDGDEEGVRSRFYTEREIELLLGMSSLHPQFRHYVPGEFVVVAVKEDERVLGEMPLLRLRADEDWREKSSHG